MVPYWTRPVELTLVVQWIMALLVVILLTETLLMVGGGVVTLKLAVTD